MNNTIEHQYLNLIEEILETGNKKNDRTGTGTLSLFGRTLRHNFKDGFPAFTTKKLAWKQVVGELLWMLSGSTNIKPMVDQGNYIWVGDAYKKYEKQVSLEEVIGNDSNILKNFMIHKTKIDTLSGYPIFERLSKEEFIERIKTDDEFSKKWGDLGPVYGRMWRDWDTDDKGVVIDQVSNIIHLLKTDPDSRRMLVSAWNPLVLHKVTLPPCHYSWQVYTRELSLEEIATEANKKGVGLKGISLAGQVFIDRKYAAEKGVPTRAISLLFNMRSSDSLLGLPFNVASYSLLLHILAEVVNMVPDELICSLGDVHIYNDHIEGAKEQIQREPYTFPTLNMNTEKWDMSSVDALVKTMSIEDFELVNYKHHPKIHFPLSN